MNQLLPAGSARFPRLTAFRLGLAAITLLAAILRLWSIDFGVPLVSHPDEIPIVFYAGGMIQEGDLNPRWFRYPALIIYIQAAVMLAVDGLDHLLGLAEDTVTSAYYVGGRVAMASFGIATVWLVGLLARRLAPARRDLCGLLAAGLLAVSLLHVKDSHYLKPDVPTGFFTALTLWFTLDALERGRRRSWLLAAAAVGLAAAAKYNGAVVALVPAAALILVQRRPIFLTRQVVATAALMSAVAVAAFLLVNPYIVITPREFLSPTDGIVAEWNHYRAGHEGAEGDDSWRWYLAELWRSGFGPTLLPLVAIGLAVQLMYLARGDRRALLLLLFPLLYYLLIGRYPVRFDRQLIPILPYLAIAGAIWIAALPRLSPQDGWLRRAVPVAGIVIAVLIFSLPLARAIEWNIAIGRPDTRYPALAWVREHVPPGATVVREWYTPPLDDTAVHDVPIRSLYEESAGKLRASGVQYVIVSSFMYGRYLQEPEKYPDQARFYERLLTRPATAHFAPAREYSGPEIHVFRAEDIADLLGGRP